MDRPTKIVRPFARFDTSTVAAGFSMSPTVINGYKQPKILENQELRDLVVAYLRDAGVVSRTLTTVVRCPLCNVPLGREMVKTDRFEWLRGSEHYIEAHELWVPALSGIVVSLTGMRFANSLFGESS